MQNSSYFRIAFAALISLSMVAYLGKANESSLRGIDSNIHAKLSLDVTSQGFLPALPMKASNAGSMPVSKQEGSYFNDHPFPFFWLNGWVMRALEPSAWSARVLTATFSTGCVALTYLIGLSLEGQLFGFIAAVFLLFTRDLILTGATVSLDPPMLFFILLSFYFWIKNRWFLVGLTAGIGLWIKTPVVLLIFPTAVIVSILGKSLNRLYIRSNQNQNQNRNRNQNQNQDYFRANSDLDPHPLTSTRMFNKEWKKIVAAMLLALSIGSLVWIFTGLLGGWNLVFDYWTRQVWGTTVQGRNLNLNSDYSMLFRMIKHGFIPGLPFLLFGLFRVAKNHLWKRSAVLISMVAILILFLAISPIRFKMDYYFNPVFPFLAFLSAYSVTDLLKKFENHFYSIFTSLSTVLMAFLLCTPTSLGPEAFVALKRYISYIQAYSHCDDSILVISGGEPLGSSQDYEFVLNFYTGKKVEIQNCDTASKILHDNHFPWIILSKENYELCISPDLKALYKTRLKVGAQYLLTTRFDSDGLGDLTPLERELRPVIGCSNQTYPIDRYHRY